VGWRNAEVADATGRERDLPGAMTTYVDTGLANEVADFLTEAGPSSCDAIARALKRRRRDVLAALRGEERFRRAGRGAFVRWHLTAQINGDGFGTDDTASIALETAPDIPAAEITAESFEARCGNPTGHRAAMATWLDDGGVRHCVLCEGPGESKPLTWDEYQRGEGGEARRDRFEADYAALIQGDATPEIRERLRNALGTVSQRT
jgi:hypothetical protein